MIARFGPPEPECGVVGWAMLAGLAVGLFSNLESVVSELVRYDGEIAPNRAWSGAIPEDAIIALRGQWINGLVIDETCARIILATE